MSRKSKEEMAKLLPNASKRKRRLGDRNDGRRLRTLFPMTRVSAYIMPDRIGSSNYIRDSIEISEIEKFIMKKRAEGLKGFGIIHVLIAAYVRACSQRPGLNRFISGQRCYSRDYVECSLVIKKEMRLDAQDTALKMLFDRGATVTDVYNQLTKLSEENKSADGDNGNFDKTARIFNFIPGLLLKFAVWFLKLLDYFGLLPRFLTRISPFHGSFFITSMGSLGIPPIYHHLYDFGNLPVFMSYGAKRIVYELNQDGEVEEKKMVDLTFVTDERICDGHYFASALKYFRQLCKNPAVLDIPPETIVEDID